jgi:ABC-type iron transport system FetAB permease component
MRSCLGGFWAGLVVLVGLGLILSAGEPLAAIGIVLVVLMLIYARTRTRRT